MQFWALIKDSFRESRDRKIYWVMLIMSVIIALGMACFSFEPGKVNILFGMWEIKTNHFTAMGNLRQDLIASIVVDGIMDTVLGGIGVLLSIVATASFFPTFLERGAVDVVLSKPIPRWKLFLFRYLGGMVFIGLQATIFVVLTFLVAGIRWGAWIPGYLLSIPLVILLFSYLYCISALVAVFTRSTVSAVMLTMLAWTGIAGVQSLDDAFTVTFPEWQNNRQAYVAVHCTRWILPKTQDITYFAKKWSKAANEMLFVHVDSPEDEQLIRKVEESETARLKVGPWKSIGSSLLFEAMIVVLAMLKFNRTDY